MKLKPNIKPPNLVPLSEQFNRNKINTNDADYSNYDNEMNSGGNVDLKIDLGKIFI